MKDRNCTRCKGYGYFMPAEGTTKADMKQCHICCGTGELPKGYIKNLNEARAAANKIKAKDGSIILKRSV